jgi:hypothetical protein
MKAIVFSKIDGAHATMANDFANNVSFAEYQAGLKESRQGRASQIGKQRSSLRTSLAFGVIVLLFVSIKALVA